MSARIAFPFLFVSLACGCGGEEFTSGGSASTGGSTSDAASQDSSQKGGAAGAAGDASAQGGSSAGGSAGNHSGGSGGGGGVAVDSGVDGSLGGAAGVGGSVEVDSGVDAEPVDYCKGTAFTLSPAQPQADQPFKVVVNVTNEWDFICIWGKVDGPNTSVKQEPNCVEATGTCSATWSIPAGTFSPGSAVARVASHYMDMSNVCCDADPDSACHLGPITVSTNGNEIAQCTFEIQ